MKDEIIVKRYVEAFLGVAKEGVGLENALQDLKNLNNVVIRENPEFLSFLESLEFTFSEKCAFIDNVLKEDFSQDTRNFLKLLLEKKRIDKLADIAEYVRDKYAQGKRVRALLRSAFPLDLELIKKIEEGLETKFRRKFKFYIDLDGTLLGGVQVIIGNRVIDGTVRRRLDELKEKLKAARI